MWEMNEDYCARVAEASGGRLIIEPYVQGAIVPATKELEGCSDGIVEMTDTYMGYYPYLLHDVAELFSGRPGGLTETQAAFWLLAEGGVLYQEMVSRIGVTRVTQTVMPTAGDVFVCTVPITGLDDIQGLKFRTASTSLAEITAIMGIQPTMIPWGEIYDAVKRGIVDCTEAGSLSVNWDMALHEVADYHYLTEVLLPGSSNDLFVNEASWAKLPSDLKAILEDCVRSECFKRNVAELEREVAMAQQYKDYGVTLEAMPKEIDDELIRVGTQYFTDKAATLDDPLYARVLESQEKYRAIYDILAVK
jgi:TRAP-type mannitol/chloroaromatic compound transport system substrate-binding protein